MSGGWRTMREPAPAGEQPTSRAMNVTASQADVRALCERHKTSISAIEALPAGGTRLVLSNADDAAVMRKAFKSKLIVGDVARTPWMRPG